MLAPDQQARVTAALAVAEANVAEADRLRPGLVTSAWSWLIGASSSAAALSADADATRTLYEVLTAKADAWRSGAEGVTDAELADFERAAGATSNEAARAGAELLTPGEALRQTTAGMLTPSAWPPWLRSAALLALVAVVVVVALPYVVGAVLRSLMGGRK